MLKPQSLDAIDRTKFTQRAAAVDPDVIARAQHIIDDVRTRGDLALRQWTKDLDGADLQHPFLAPAEWDALAAQCPADVAAAIEGNLSRIRSFHAAQIGDDQTMEVAPGVTLGRRAIPFQVAACYVPGGRASYPSSVLMTVAPAQLAGVERIIVVTPPRADGSIDPAVAYAAKAAGATDILRAGGAQAIAAVAQGTGTIPGVDCVVGPGNAYVTAAKQLLADQVRIDSPAGPSELLVLADATANPRFIALDMVAQAEHDPDAQCILVTDSADLAEQVNAQLTELESNASRQAIVEEALAAHGAILVTNSLGDAIEFANQYAAEHLEIHTKDPATIMERIRNAGSIFLGSHSPVPVGDYGSGTNHVLPTMGYARTHSGLNVDTFRKWITWQELTPAGLANIASDITVLARSEGLEGHAAAVEGRQ